jgi:hypothetical protein
MQKITLSALSVVNLSFLTGVGGPQGSHSAAGTTSFSTIYHLAEDV